MVSIVDNYLDQNVFNELQTFICGAEFPWYYNPSIDYADEDISKFQFVHIFYVNSPASQYIENLTPIIDTIDPLQIQRIKANLLVRTPNIVENSLHTDLDILSEEKQKQWKTSIFYMNTNNGYTKFEDGTKVESVANRLVTFSTNMKHCGTSCTDENTRIVINFNYFGKDL